MQHTKVLLVSALLIGLVSTGIANSAAQNKASTQVTTQEHALGYKHASPSRALQQVLNGKNAVLMYEESWAAPWEGLERKPQNLELVNELYNTKKLRKWDASEKQANIALLEQLLNEPAAGGEGFGALTATWVNRGPYNKPGCFAYADLDSTDNTMWGLTCAHYGANMFIFKGSLEGDNFKLISGKLPTRFNDMIGFKVGQGKRLLVSTEGQQAYYTDNDGQSWQQPTGLPTTGIQSISVNRAGGYKTYASDGQKIYISNDTGRTYSVLQDFGSKVNKTKLYSIRYGKQPGAGNLYLARNGTFYKWNGSTFAQRGTYTQPTSGWGRFEMQGDTRKLYLHDHNRYFVSTNEGTSWTEIKPPSYYYGDLVDVNKERMISDHTFGVHPENPEIMIGGYADWLISKNGGSSTITHSAGWGYYQGFTGTSDLERVTSQDQRTRTGHHPDLQGSMFFYDKNGQVVSIRASDGGLYRSYNEWTLSGWTGNERNVYHNITLLGESQQETYINSMITGANNVDHVSWGTQDQGDQTAYGKTGTLYNVLQNPGGDGRSKVTGDGLTAFSFSSTNASAPFAMYSGSTWRGTRGMGDNNISLGTSGIKDLVIDRTAPSTSFWSLGDNGVSYHVWNGSSYTNTARNPGGSGTVRALAQSKSSTSTLYTIRGGSVYKSTNKGTSWGTGVNWGGSASGNCGIAVHPTDPNQVLVACESSNSTRAAYSADGGVSWTNVTGILPNTSVSDMQVEKTGRFFVASTTAGPYAFDAQNKTWIKLGGTSAPIFYGMSMEYLEPSNTMRFSTFGQGTWDLQIGVNGTSSSSMSSSSVSSSSTQSPIQPITGISGSNEETSGEGPDNGRLIHSIDGDIATFWHSRWSSNAATMPHTLTYGLPGTYRITGIDWLNRQENDNGWSKSVRFYFGASQGVWTDSTTVNIDATGDWQSFTSLPNMGSKFVQVKILSNQAGTNTSALSEIRFFGTPSFSSSSSLSSSSLSSSSLSSSSVITAQNPGFANNQSYQLQAWDRQGLTLSGKGEVHLRLMDINGQKIADVKGMAASKILWNQEVQSGQHILELCHAYGLKRWMITIP
jgi:hypothetical protein